MTWCVMPLRWAELILRQQLQRPGGVGNMSFVNGAVRATTTAYMSICHRMRIPSYSDVSGPLGMLGGREGRRGESGPLGMLGGGRGEEGSLAQGLGLGMLGWKERVLWFVLEGGFCSFNWGVGGQQSERNRI